MDSASSSQSTSSLLLRIYQSPIGKKLITGITGLALAIFALAHMLGNLLLFAGREAYNTYAYRLEQFGPIFWVVEMVLLGSVILHATVGIQIALAKRQARPVGYQTYQSAGAPSHQSISSRTMIITGSVLGVFLVSHILTFKFGVVYSTVIAGVESRDFSRLVIETFHNPLYTFGYTAVIMLLGFHLRHGVWSGLQSLGAMSRGLKPIVYGVGALLAVLIAVGFMVLPLGIYIGWVQ